MQTLSHAAEKKDMQELKKVLVEVMMPSSKEAARFAEAINQAVQCNGICFSGGG